MRFSSGRQDLMMPEDKGKKGQVFDKMGDKMGGVSVER